MYTNDRVMEWESLFIHHQTHFVENLITLFMWQKHNFFIPHTPKKPWKNFPYNLCASGKLTNEFEAVQFVILCRFERSTSQTSCLILTCGCMIWETFQSDLLLGHQFARTDVNKMRKSCQFRGYWMFGDIIWLPVLIKSVLHTKTEISSLFTHLSYMVVLCIPRPQKIAKVSNIEISQFVNCEPFAWT